jgi:leucyl aminopeptidase
MQVNVIEKNLEKAEFPITIIGLTKEQVNNPPELLKKKIEHLVTLGDFKGEKDSSKILYPDDMKTPRIMLAGLGKASELTIEDIRRRAGSISRIVRDLGVKEAGIHLSSFTAHLKQDEVAEALTQSFIMGSYNEPYYKTRDLDKFKQLEKITLFNPTINESIKTRANTGKIIGEAVNYCRRLAWGPGNLVNPTMLAGEATRIGSENNIKVTIFDREQAEQIGLHSFLAVAQGTDEPPKFIIMEYGQEYKETVALIGKGITFDTGGISLKSRDGMPAMKADMTGGAVVLATMQAAARLGLELHIVGIVPATDNMPDGKAYHPGDVVRSYSGQTIEVISTDAEGRMILNDALTYAAQNYKPRAMFDFATLTGSIHVAVGDHAIGYFANADWVSERLEEASNGSGEKVWRMPLWEEYDEQLKSDVADFKHTGGRPGGAITAARFLNKFVMDTPWAHLDIAGHSEQKTDKGYNPKGSKGPAVRLVLELLRKWKTS